MITVNRVPPPLVHIYYGDKFIGTCRNENEFMDVRIQVAKERVEGYTAHFDGLVIPINKYGTPISWPKGFYDTTQKQLSELFKVQKQIREDDNTGITKQDSL